MLAGASLISQPQPRTGATSLAGILFSYATITQNPQDYATIVPPAGSKVLCSHCNRTIYALIGDCIVSLDRHDSQQHKSVVPISALGLMRIPTGNMTNERLG